MHKSKGYLLYAQKKPLIEVLGKGDVNRGLQLLNSVGLSEAFLYVKPFQQLSTGQKYRAMLASLFSKGSNIWLIDEFCENLDPITTHLIARKLSTVAREHKATVIVSAVDYAPFLETLCPDKILLLQGATQYEVFTFDEFQAFLEKSNQDPVQEGPQDVYSINIGRAFTLFSINWHPVRMSFFREVWGHGRLQFGDGANQIDDVDIHSAQLICCAQSQQKPTLIVLPDEASHRIPMLFATVLPETSIQ